MSPYYQDEAVTIYHGDCREVLPVAEARVLVTDPPFGIGFAAQPTKWQRRSGMTPESWDSAPAGGVASLAERFAAAAVWGGNHFALPRSRGWLCWIKPDAPPSMGTVELCWTSRSANARHLECSISATNGERVGHPTQKPLSVMRWTILYLETEGLILDPFMGSGTTLRAAKDLGRKAIGIEIEERYCEIAAKRMAQGVLDLGAAS
jgi:DNA modification methylase